MKSHIGQKPAAWWLTYVAKWRQSVMSKAGYCNKQSLNLSSFRYWLRKSRTAGSHVWKGNMEHLLVAASQDEPVVPLEEMERRHIQRILKVAGNRLRGSGGAAELLAINPLNLISPGDTLVLQRLAASPELHDVDESLEEVERRHIQAVLKATGGRIKGFGGAAERLRINPSTLYSRMRKLGIGFEQP